jgi:hypothetical protein
MHEKINLQTLHTCASNCHWHVEKFPYLIPAQNNFYDLISIAAVNNL